MNSSGLREVYAKFIYIIHYLHSQTYYLHHRTIDSQSSVLHFPFFVLIYIYVNTLHAANICHPLSCNIMHAMAVHPRYHQ